jgi:hypothetical protein
MPYTISHAAAVLPFSRWLTRLQVLSATVIGSMVPDLGYLMPAHPPRMVTHSALSLFTFSLPVGLLCYWVFQRLMKTPLLSLLPDQAYMRWRPFAAPAALNSPWQWLLAAAGVLAGAVTHLAWDGFTHEGARGMRMIPELDDWFVEVHGHHLIGAGLLQNASSLIGLAIVAAVVAYALRRGTPHPVAPRALSQMQRRRWVLVFIVVTVACTVAFDFLVIDDELRFHSLRAHAFNIAISFLRGLVLSVLIVSVLVNRYLRYRGSGNASRSEV